jgi:hypothetical protein
MNTKNVVDYMQEECKKNLARHEGNDSKRKQKETKIKDTFNGARTKDPTAQGLGADHL